MLCSEFATDADRQTVLHKLLLHQSIIFPATIQEHQYIYLESSNQEQSEFLYQGLDFPSASTKHLS